MTFNFIGHDEGPELRQNIPVIPTQFEVAALWESGYSKVESEFIKTQNCLQAITCASFEYYRNITSPVGFTPEGTATFAGAC